MEYALRRKHMKSESPLVCICWLHPMTILRSSQYSKNIIFPTIWQIKRSQSWVNVAHHWISPSNSAILGTELRLFLIRSSRAIAVCLLARKARFLRMKIILCGMIIVIGGVWLAEALSRHDFTAYSDCHRPYCGISADKQNTNSVANFIVHTLQLFREIPAKWTKLQNPGR